MSDDRMTMADVRAAYKLAQKKSGDDRFTMKDVESAAKELKEQKLSRKGGGMAQRGMGAAYKKGGMTKARAGKMMNLKMTAKKKKGKK